jgi:twitching motility protein PilT
MPVTAAETTSDIASETMTVTATETMRDVSPETMPAIAAETKPVSATETSAPSAEESHAWEALSLDATVGASNEPPPVVAAPESIADSGAHEWSSVSFEDVAAAPPELTAPEASREASAKSDGGDEAPPADAVAPAAATSGWDAVSFEELAPLDEGFELPEAIAEPHEWKSEPLAADASAQSAERQPPLDEVDDEAHQSPAAPLEEVIAAAWGPAVLPFAALEPLGARAELPWNDEHHDAVGAESHVAVPPESPRPHLVETRSVEATGARTVSELRSDRTSDEAPAVTADTATRPSSETPAAPAVVLPISRSAVRSDAPPPPPLDDATLSGLERLLRLSSARAASTLYLSSESKPSIRVDGELQILDGEPVHTSRDVESLLLTLMPERSHEALRTGALTEWICDIDGVGRVRCMSFRDHRGPGGVFRLMPTRSVSVEQLALPRPVQALAVQPEGLLLVAGPRSSGKRTLIAALVDLMNRTRRDHIITLEREINIVHDPGLSFVSQREVRGGDDDMLAAARGALRENPDVLVVEDLRSRQLMAVALEAAASGHLVVGGFSAQTATAAVDRIIDLYAPEQRRQVQLALADSLRGVVVQVLVRRVGGGRVAAREVLLNTPAVSSVIAEGKTSQLPMAIEGGRRYGMMPLNDALVSLVQNGTIDARDAYRYSSDRGGFLAAMHRRGIDTSFIERPA